MDQRDLSPADFAELVGASESGVIKWCRDERVPRPGFMTRIAEATNGKVTAADFYAAPSEAA